jgi:hypothetical protein
VSDEEEESCRVWGLKLQVDRPGLGELREWLDRARVQELEVATR